MRVAPRPTVDRRSFELIHDGVFKLTRIEAVNVMSLVNRALQREGICSVRIERIRSTDSGRIFGITTPTSTLSDLLECWDMVLRQARLVHSSIRDVAPQQRWRWARIHSIPLARYVGRHKEGGLPKLREELEAENSGVKIPAEIRWLSGEGPGEVPE